MNTKDSLREVIDAVGVFEALSTLSEVIREYAEDNFLMDVESGYTSIASQIKRLSVDAYDLPEPEDE